MCGIVGVVGEARAKAIILEGLQRLEYRGYDSAGIALLNAEGFARARAVGKVGRLVEKAGELGEAKTGIGHTRWATHGAVTEANAHPHHAGRVMLVHNGIIENFRSLRAELEKEGRTFESETDTEIVAHLIDREVEEGADLEVALSRAVERLKGAFALAILIEGEETRLFGARRGAPLIAGLNGSAGFIASDPLALSGEADSLVYLKDGDIAVVSPGEVTVIDSSGKPARRERQPAPTSHVAAEKGNYRHFMQKEIFDQPDVIGRTASHYVDPVANVIRTIEGVDLSETDRLLIVACGTAAFAGQVARYWFAELAGLACEVEIASEFRYRAPTFLKGDRALFISQSGETADTLEAMRLCAEHRVPSMALINTVHSTMAREADLVLPTLAGPEIGVASTKAFTCQLTALACLAALAGRQRGRIGAAREREIVEALLGMPARVSKALDCEAEIVKLAPELAEHRTVLYLGRGPDFPMALEAALKLKEISYIHAEGYAAGELKHGPIALVEEGVPVIVLAPSGPQFEKTRSSIQQVRSRGARVTGITDASGAQALQGELSQAIVIPDSDPLIRPILEAVAVQLIAYHVAVYKGTDVDQPRNLAKSVTVE
ncbi:glutamine--fructose-6-phosphate transaminase (isomerizing) [Marinicauda algicola]|uniref:Glutamine--fructose-6-phosphate aminotransferase [isomerizing] n=1 Tax=Marinicauda algicola TaxID=2029849 RepID=A0A4V3RYH4_9PROT|nr:glutamine--fructose-6-phosphate transaminase (isomerizing) [Marinicauda algicola]TGY90319.1 glutamine--fructose-6-phosphate transaminase (isomerizing) [Marinicauda algicola]